MRLILHRSSGNAGGATIGCRLTRLPPALAGQVAHGMQLPVLLLLALQLHHVGVVRPGALGPCVAAGLTCKNVSVMLKLHAGFAVLH